LRMLDNYESNTQVSRVGIWLIVMSHMWGIWNLESSNPHPSPHLARERGSGA